MEKRAAYIDRCLVDKGTDVGYSNKVGDEAGRSSGNRVERTRSSSWIALTGLSDISRTRGKKSCIHRHMLSGHRSERWLQ